MTILGSLICLSCLGQKIEYDTLNIRLSSPLWISDTTIVSTPFPTKYESEIIWVRQLQKEIDEVSCSNTDLIYLRLRINEKGILETITVVKGKYADCIAEAIRIVKSQGSWQPTIVKYRGENFPIAMDIQIPLKIN